MAENEIQGGIGTLRHPPGAPALIPGRVHDGPDENQAAEKLPMPGRA